MPTTKNVHNWEQMKIRIELHIEMKAGDLGRKLCFSLGFASSRLKVCD